MHSLCSRMEERLSDLSREASPAPTAEEITSLMVWAQECAPVAARMDNEEFGNPSDQTKAWVETASAADLERTLAVLDMLDWARRRRWAEDNPERAVRLGPAAFARPRALAALTFLAPPPAFAVA